MSMQPHQQTICPECESPVSFGALQCRCGWKVPIPAQPKVSVSDGPKRYCPSCLEYISKPFLIAECPHCYQPVNPDKLLPGWVQMHFLKAKMRELYENWVGTASEINFGAWCRDEFLKSWRKLTFGSRAIKRP